MSSEDKMLDNSLESAMNMTQDEIERLLAQTASEGTTENSDLQDLDLDSLLDSMTATDDGDAQDISRLLSKADNNEAVDADILALLKQQEETGETAYDAMDLFSGEVPKKESFLKKLLSKFKKKEADTAENEKKNTKKEKIEKKKIEKKGKKGKTENENPVDEQEIAAIPEKPAKKSKDKKKEKKSDKKSERKEEITDDIDELLEVKEKPKSKKEKTDKKDKKKKPVKEKEKKGKDKKESPEKIREKEKPTIADAIADLEDEQAEMPHKKKIIMVFVACILIMLGFLVVNHYFTGHANKRLAEEAYEAQDYLECYQLLYGQRLNDNQAAIFHRSEMILKMDIFWGDYNEFAKNKKWLEGLDKLTQFVHRYPELKEYALQWNCQDLTEDAYGKVQNILAEEYETDADTVSAIADLKDDVDYTKALRDIIREKEKRDELNEKYPDLLPEEESKVLN